MKAIVQNAYGSPDKLELRDIDIPKIKDDEVLVKVRASAVNAGDYFSMTGRPWLARMSVGFPKPKNHVLGWDVAGLVEAVGKNVTSFRPGDDVYGVCGRAFAEYVSTAAAKLAAKPPSLSFEEAAAVPSAGCAALQGLRDVGRVRPGQGILINGAAGGVGTFAVQIGKSLGAEVTGVCSTAHVDMVRTIGADHVVDYSRQDFARNGRRYDLILDNAASRSFADLKRALAPGGVIVPNSGHAGMGYVIKAFALSSVSGRVKRPFLSVPRTSDLEFLKTLVEAGTLRPVIDRTYPLAEVPTAVAYVGRGHARGKVVISV